jgi:anti-anti-sigma factor
MSLQRRSLNVRESENITRVTVTDEDMREDNLQAVGEELLAIADGLTHRRLELDMAAVRYLTSTSLGKLVALHRRLRDKGGSLVIANVTGVVHEIFEVTQLHRVLNIVRLPCDAPCLLVPPLAS